MDVCVLNGRYSNKKNGNREFVSTKTEVSKSEIGTFRRASRLEVAD